MRILFICHRFPYPPTGGAKVRSFNMIKHLSREHDVTVVSLARSEQEREEAKGIAPYCHAHVVERVYTPVAVARMIGSLPTTIPSTMGYFYSRRLAQRVTQLLENSTFGLICAHSSSVAQYVANVSGIPKILDFCDMDSQKWLSYVATHRLPMSMGYWLEGRKLARAERMLASRFDLCTVATPAELESFNALSSANGVGAWFPNGVDLEQFVPFAAEPEPDSICFIGRMDYYPNQQGVIDFCRDTLPLIRKARPGASFTIIGANPSQDVVQLGGLPGVTVTGTVPDVRTYVNRSAVSVAPLKIARGTQNKILESMAMGVPVVTTPLVASGIDAVPGEHFLSAERSQDFAAAVVDVLQNPTLRKALAQHGRKRMETHHSWSAAMQRFDDLVASTLHRFAAVPAGTMRGDTQRST